jgi:hypothetical protein
VSYELDEETKERMMVKRRLDNAIVVFFEHKFGRRISNPDRHNLLQAVHTIFNIERNTKFHDKNFYMEKAKEFESIVEGTNE